MYFCTNPLRCTDYPSKREDQEAVEQIIKILSPPTKQSKQIYPSESSIVCHEGSCFCRVLIQKLEGIHSL
uniref:Putative ovule protein n=1 Tax=Solanum chacoense TaxID=4108 RepID=A0A0V0GRQ6_SOLCH